MSTNGAPKVGPLPDLPLSYPKDDLKALCFLLQLEPNNITRIDITPEAIVIDRVQLHDGGVITVTTTVPVVP